MKMKDNGITFIPYELQCFLKMDLYQQALLRKFYLLVKLFEFCNLKRQMKKIEFQWEIFKHFQQPYQKFRI